jgi:hypothetical protein
MNNFATYVKAAFAESRTESLRRLSKIIPHAFDGEFQPTPIERYGPIEEYRLSGAALISAIGAGLLSSNPEEHGQGS